MGEVQDAPSNSRRLHQIQAINEVLPSTLVPTSWEAGSVAIVNQAEQQSNLDLRGLFISGTWKF